MKNWRTSRYLPEEIREGVSIDEEGSPLCRWCKEAVPRGRSSFCSEGCVHEWCLRTSNTYLREHVFKRDKGVCGECGLDTAALRREINRLSMSEGDTRLATLGLSRKRFGKSLWEADHIVPVAEGGGCSGLTNFQTLCWKCHGRKTAEQRKRK